MWSGLLGIEEGEISVTANFFHLGGTSSQAMRMIGMVQKRGQDKKSKLLSESIPAGG